MDTTRLTFGILDDLFQLSPHLSEVRVSYRYGWGYTRVGLEERKYFKLNNPEDIAHAFAYEGAACEG